MDETTKLVIPATKRLPKVGDEVIAYRPPREHPAHDPGSLAPPPPVHDPEWEGGRRCVVARYDSGVVKGTHVIDDIEHPHIKLAPLKAPGAKGKPLGTFDCFTLFDAGVIDADKAKALQLHQWCEWEAD